MVVSQTLPWQIRIMISLRYLVIYLRYENNAAYVDIQRERIACISCNAPSAEECDKSQSIFQLNQLNITTWIRVRDGGTDLCFLNLGCSSRWVLSLSPAERALILAETRLLRSSELAWTVSRSEKPLVPSRIETQFLTCPAWSLVPISSDLYRLTIN